jgi:hypothetical protein
MRRAPRRANEILTLVVELYKEMTVSALRLVPRRE